MENTLTELKADEKTSLDNINEQRDNTIKCETCIYNTNKRSFISIQKINDDKALAISFDMRCNLPSRLIIKDDLTIIAHQCADYIEDIDLTFNDEVEEVPGSTILKTRPKKVEEKKSSSLVHQMKSAMSVINMKLSRPLALAIPTGVEKKSEEQIKAEREREIQYQQETGDNLPYLRVLEFEKLARGHNKYQIDKFCKALRDLDKKTILSFITRIDNEFLISYDKKTESVRFYNPSEPELEILSRAFEKWLRFRRF